MPLRKTKGRRRPRAPAAGRAKGDPESEVHVNPEKDKEQSHDPVEDKETHPESADGCGMDEEERRARETIALLAKKYQVTNKQAIARPERHLRAFLFVYR